MVNVMRGTCLTIRPCKGPRSIPSINLLMSVFAGLAMAAGLSACAGSGPLTHETGETASVAEQPAAAAPVRAKPAIVRSAEIRSNGPMQLHTSRPDAPKAAVANAALVPGGDRLEFVDWFGAAAEPARAPNPVDQLRKARAVTASMEPQATENAGRRMFSDDENGRLLPATMVLPKPQDDKGALRRPEPANPEKPVMPVKHTVPAESKPPRLTTGSLRPFAEKPEDAKGKQGAVVQQLRQMEKKLKAAGSGKANSATVIASASKGGPTRHSPLRIHIAKNRSDFNGHERDALTALAERHLESGRKVHILSIARGPAGGSRETRTRVRRLLGHADRASIYLAHQGVPRSQIDVMTSEQRMTGVDFGPNGGDDQDRLEFYLD